MNRFRALLRFLALLLGVAAACPAQEDSSTPWNVRIELQIVAVPEPVAVPLIKELLDEKKIEAATTRLQALIVEGKATLIGWPIVLMQSDATASTASVTEVRFPSEFDARSIAFYSNQGEPDPALLASKEVKVDVATFAPVPIGFEMREVGLMLQVSPAVSRDGRAITLQFNPKHVTMKGAVAGQSKPSPTEQPVFDVSQSNSTLTVRNGQRTLVGVSKVSAPAGHLEVQLLKATTYRIE